MTMRICLVVGRRRIFATLAVVLSHARATVRILGGVHVTCPTINA